MKFDITLTLFKQHTTDKREIYRYDCFIDNIFMGFGTWLYEQDEFTVYQYFVKMILQGWDRKYKNIYNRTNKITRNDLKYLNIQTIISEDIQDIDLIIKKVNQQIREQKIQEDF